MSTTGNVLATFTASWDVSKSSPSHTMGLGQFYKNKYYFFIYYETKVGVLSSNDGINWSYNEYTLTVQSVSSSSATQKAIVVGLYDDKLYYHNSIYLYYAPLNSDGTLNVNGIQQVHKYKKVTNAIIADDKLYVNGKDDSLISTPKQNIYRQLPTISSDKTYTYIKAK